MNQRGRNQSTPVSRHGEAETETVSIRPEINWGTVIIIAAIMAPIVFVVDNPVLRTGVAIVALLIGIQVIVAGAETEVDNPLLQKLHESTHGLDRRKYGRLRAYTDRFLDHVRAMNRTAIDARQGKMTPHHATAELDRISQHMDSVMEEIRKSAGVPTPELNLRN